MEIFKGKSENEKNLKNLYDEILRLSEQINAVKEKTEKEYPLLDSLSKMKEEIEGLKKKTREIEVYKSYADRISKQLDDVNKKQNEDKEVQSMWPHRVVLLFFAFSGLCVIYLFVSIGCVEVNEPIALLIVGAIIYIVMAVVLVLFAYQNWHVFKSKGNKNTKK